MTDSRTAPRRPRTASITRARTGLTEQQKRRQRRYVAAMTVRTSCVVVMACTWERWPVLAVCALVGGVLIPFVAVVAAQAWWPRGRGVRPAVARASEEPAGRAPLEPSLILPADRKAA
ncbi:DUF3099 domain-containing protein [Streptomyces boninensis]|uniref:DUF3099 domain-containing protein n=1 Tax=Streptomyces boninensis TaxID=2039455 RepID=UPI003B21933C